jgi:hypothetical protein
MTNETHDRERDDELHGLLTRSGTPLVPDGMDERILAAYRRRVGLARPWWHRLLTGSVRVPLPVAVAVVTLLIVSTALALRPAPAPTAGTPAPSELIQAARRTEPPVVTRTSLAGFRPVAEVTATVFRDAGERRP